MIYLFFENITKKIFENKTLRIYLRNKILMTTFIIYKIGWNTLVFSNYGIMNVVWTFQSINKTILNKHAPVFLENVFMIYFFLIGVKF